jgi:hypothetical protein
MLVVESNSRYKIATNFGKREGFLLAGDLTMKPQNSEKEMMKFEVGSVSSGFDQSWGRHGEVSTISEMCLGSIP